MKKILSKTTTITTTTTIQKTSTINSLSNQPQPTPKNQPLADQKNVPESMTVIFCIIRSHHCIGEVDDAIL